MTSHRRNLAVLLVASVLLLGTRLGSTDFWAPDEPRYGQIAEEVRAMDHGLRSIVLLHLGGEPYTQKPPLYYWLAAAIGGLTGDRVSEVAARLPSVVAGVLAVLLTYLFGRRLFARPLPALLAGALLLTSFRFAHQARRAQLDVLLTLFELAAMFVFWRIDLRTRDGQGVPPSLVLAFHAALGAAALTKGPVGWLPLLVVVAYLWWDGRARSLRTLLPAWSLLVSVGPVVAWTAAATWLGPAGYFQEAVVDNVVGRVVDATSHVRPFYYFFYQLPLDFLPWTLLWPFAIAAAIAARGTGADPRRPWRLLVVWVAVPFLVFSLASGKRGLYLLPVFPALALLCGAGLDVWLAKHPRVPGGLRIGGALIGLGATAAGIVATALEGTVELDAFPGFSVTAGMLGTFMVLSGLGAVVAAVSVRTQAAVAAGIATALTLELAIFALAFPSFDEEKSPRPIAELVASMTSPGEALGVFDDAGLAGGILYYGDRPVEILPRPEHVAAFLDSGGRFVIFERWKLPWLEPVGEFQTHGSVRRDRRELAVMSRIAPEAP